MRIPRFLLPSAIVLFLAVLPLSVSAQSVPRPDASAQSSSTFPAISSIAPLGVLASSAAIGSGANPQEIAVNRPGIFRCYALRVYRFAETHPGSGVMKPNGSSTCEAAPLFHLKGVTVSVKAK